MSIAGRNIAEHELILDRGDVHHIYPEIAGRRNAALKIYFLSEAKGGVVHGLFWREKST